MLAGALLAIVLMTMILLATGTPAEADPGPGSDLNPSVSWEWIQVTGVIEEPDGVGAGYDQYEPHTDHGFYSIIDEATGVRYELDADWWNMSAMVGCRMTVYGKLVRDGAQGEPPLLYIEDVTGFETCAGVTGDQYEPTDGGGGGCAGHCGLKIAKEAEERLGREPDNKEIHERALDAVRSPQPVETDAASTPEPTASAQTPEGSSGEVPEAPPNVSTPEVPETDGSREAYEEAIEAALPPDAGDGEASGSGQDNAAASGDVKDLGGNPEESAPPRVGPAAEKTPEAPEGDGAAAERGPEDGDTTETAGEKVAETANEVADKAAAGMANHAAQGGGEDADPKEADGSSEDGVETRDEETAGGHSPATREAGGTSGAGNALPQEAIGGDAEEVAAYERPRSERTPALALGTSVLLLGGVFLARRLFWD